MLADSGNVKMTGRMNTTSSQVGTLAVENLVIGGVPYSAPAPPAPSVPDGQYNNQALHWDTNTSAWVATPNQRLSLGRNAGGGNYSTCLGINAGQNHAGQANVFIGQQAGQTGTGANAFNGVVGIGTLSANNKPRANSVSIGTEAGKTNVGQDSVNIGRNAGRTNSVANSIVLNASGAELNASQAGFHVDPIRNVTAENVLGWNTTTKEITYYTPTPTYGVWYFTNHLDLSSNADFVQLTTWSNSHQSNFGSINPNGTGHFSFPTVGVYRIEARITTNSNAGQLRRVDVAILHNDGTNDTTKAHSRNHGELSGTSGFGDVPEVFTATCSTIVNVTNTGSQYVFIKALVETSGTYNSIWGTEEYSTVQIFKI